MSSRAFSRSPAMRPLSALRAAPTSLPDMRERVPVTIFAGPNSQGELILLWTDAALEKNEREMAAEFALSQGSLRASGVSEAHLQNRLASYLTGRQACMDAYRRERDAALPSARDYDFVLVLPFLKDWQHIVDEVYEKPVTFDAMTDEGTRAAVLDERINRSATRYREMLLKNDGLETPNGRVLTSEEIDALDPLLSSTLGVWLTKLTDASPLRKMLILPHSASPYPVRVK